MNKWKEKIMNASLKVRLFVTMLVSGLFTAGSSVFADEAGTRQIREASSSAITTVLNDIKSGVTSTISEAMPLILGIAGLLVVAFATIKIAKRFFSKAV